MAKRPNIILITSDQQRWDCFGFGPRAVRMPHLGRLASRGVRFDCAITPNAVCQPARASLLTGLLPLTHGAADNGIDLDPAIGTRGFAARLGASAAGSRRPARRSGCGSGLDADLPGDLGEADSAQLGPSVSRRSRPHA